MASSSSASHPNFTSSPPSVWVVVHENLPVFIPPLTRLTLKHFVFLHVTSLGCILFRKHLQSSFVRIQGSTQHAHFLQTNTQKKKTRVKMFTDACVCQKRHTASFCLIIINLAPAWTTHVDRSFPHCYVITRLPNQKPGVVSKNVPRPCKHRFEK